ncbi:hypothetical protein Pmani_005628 [Petrolisthes manimaculis]|uniref:glucose-6-phosphatase n=1 Tax=Petrolisthes manimaculis TaxID=1843537 RepID=A0AAE1QEL1_9EUCA|nr:hypothetical protein Pmani_005628 [Petrolisthes manimaculis]
MEAPDEANLTISEKWNMKSVEVISSLQEHLEPYESWVVGASVYGDNREAFTLFFPILAGIYSDLGARALWASILVEWSNLILKWMFMGDRPYWWIGETHLYTDETLPNLRQFPNTCEAGPGTPSGHLMLNVALFYVVCKGISNYFIWCSKRIGKCSKSLLTGLLYMLYFMWIGVIFVSRLYIQAHFIHQNILGIFFGLLVGNVAWRTRWLVRMGSTRTVTFTLFLITISASTYFMLLKKGMDPLWTLPLALKYCSQPEYVKVDTRPFYLMARFTGASLGLGFGIASSRRHYVMRAPWNTLRSLLLIKFGYFMGRLATIIQATFPTDDLLILLTLTFGLNIALPYIIIAVLPSFIFYIHFTFFNE